MSLIDDYSLRLMAEHDQSGERLRAILAEMHDRVGLVGTTAVPAGGDLQRALDAGGRIQLEPGVTYEGSFVAHRAGTRLEGRGARLHGPTGPALYLPPRTQDLTAIGLTCTSDGKGAVVQLGDNNPLSQREVLDVPRDLALVNVRIPTHRGRRGFEVNANAYLDGCTVDDHYDATGVDHQAVWIGSVDRGVTIVGGRYVAACENFMSGGDTNKLGVTAMGIYVADALFTKPLTWLKRLSTWDGVERNVKNLCEVKAGDQVRFHNCTLSGACQDDQDGYAFVLTPRNGAIVRDIQITDCTVTSVAAGLQILGRDNKTATPVATQGIRVERTRFSISKAKLGGRGCLALLVNGVGDVTFLDCVGLLDGDQLIEADTSVAAGQIGPVTMRGCQFSTGPTALKANGANYGDTPAASYAGRELRIGAIAGNRFADAPNRFRRNFPDNVWITRAELEQAYNPDLVAR